MVCSSAILFAMEATTRIPLSGRRAQAAQNDQLILDAAQAVFLADPGAPISAVARRAGVGISALYRRYASKEELLRRLATDGLQRYIAEAEAALADDGDPWTVIAEFMRCIVEADTHSLVHRLAGTFTPSEELSRKAQWSHDLARQIVDRARAAGVIRRDIVTDDLSVLFEMLAAIRVGDGQRTSELRRRYLELLLDALRNPSEVALPGPAPAPEELSRRWLKGTGAGR
jgi:AcrR family transcriptional regulator